MDGGQVDVGEIVNHKLPTPIPPQVGGEQPSVGASVKPSPLPPTGQSEEDGTPSPVPPLVPTPGPSASAQVKESSLAKTGSNTLQVLPWALAMMMAAAALQAVRKRRG